MDFQTLQNIGDVDHRPSGREAVRAKLCFAGTGMRKHNKEKGAPYGSRIE